MRHVPQPVHFSASNAGLKVFLSTNIAPVEQAFTTGQNGFLSQSP